MLRGDGIAVLETRKADLERFDAHGARQLARHPLGIRATLAHAQQCVRSFAARGETQQFVDFEVFRRCAQFASPERATPCGRRRERRPKPMFRDHAEGSDIVSNKTTACAARPSLRPTKPRCSVVVALMFTWFSVTPSICARERRISSR